MKHLILALVLTFSACAKPPISVGPDGAAVWKSNEVAVAIGLLQSAAINLNKVQVCEPLPCHPLVSDANVRIVIDAVEDGIVTLRSTPAGWKATGQAVVDRIDKRLDASGQGKMKAYTAAASAVIGGL